MIKGLLFMMAMFSMTMIGLAIRYNTEKGERRDHADWLARRKSAAKDAVAQAKAAYDAKFADPRDPSPEARQMRFAISKARKELKAVQKEEREFFRPARQTATQDTSSEDDEHQYAVARHAGEDDVRGW